MMAKLNKTTHLMILFTFAIVFIVIYLYYTIGDVKKMSSEVKRLTADVSRLNQDVQNILGNLKVGVPTCNVPAVQQKPQQVQPVVVQPVVPQPVKAPVQQPAVVNDSESDDEDDDASSVNTEELKKIINDVEEDVEEDDEEGVDEAEKISVEDGGNTEAPKTSVPSEEQLKKMKYDDLKEVCKAHGVSTKGTKDQLISKLLSA